MTDLSILIPTYNQEQYIAQTIQSIENQNIQCSYEVLIGDDYSTDSTVDMIYKSLKNLSLSKNYHVFINNKNYGGLRNIQNLLNHAKGQFFIILEGDDFWLKSDGINQAVELLKNKKDIGLVGLAYTVYKGNRHTKNIQQPLRSKKITQSSIAFGHFLHLGASVVRKSIFQTLPESFIGLPIGDYPIFWSILERSNGYFLNEKTMAYRINDNGIWSLKDRNYKVLNTIKTLDFMIQEFNASTARNILKIYRNYLQIISKQKVKNNLSKLIIFVKMTLNPQIFCVYVFIKLRNKYL